VSHSQRSRRLYRLLLLLTLVLVVAIAVPGPILVIRCIAYLLLTLLLALALPGVGLPLRALGLACAVAQVLWLPSGGSDPRIGLLLLLLVTLFIALSLHRLILCLAREPAVDGAVVAGATAGYLVLGLTGGLVLTLLDLQLGGGFRDSISGEGVQLPAVPSLSQANPIWDQNFQRINYFAFVSLTTVGYGDITPSHPLVQLASVALSVLGPLYIAVVMGVLISRMDLSRWKPPLPSRPRRRFRAPARRDREPGASEP
jgi:voltage-gated potassium channel